MAIGNDSSLQLWEMDQLLREVCIERPLLASWDSKTHPAQVRLQNQLHHLSDQLGDLNDLGDGLGLGYTIDVQDPIRLLRHHDLENYLTPIVNFLGSMRFRHVRAKKHVGGGSRLCIYSTRTKLSPCLPDWSLINARMSGSAQSKHWKVGLREAIISSGARVLPPGEVAVEAVWTVSPRRNWVGLWKPTGDAMGPLLGNVRSPEEFNPQDDRITSLGFHLHHDPMLGHDVEVSLWAGSLTRYSDA